MLSLFHVNGIFLDLFLLFSVGTSDEAAAAASTASLPTLVSSVSSSPSPSPVIGILTQKIWHNNETASSYIAASYVKWIESGGARHHTNPLCRRSNHTIVWCPIPSRKKWYVSRGDPEDGTIPAEPNNDTAAITILTIGGGG